MDFHSNGPPNIPLVEDLKHLLVLMLSHQNLEVPSIRESDHPRRPVPYLPPTMSELVHILPISDYVHGACRQAVRPEVPENTTRCTRPLSVRESTCDKYRHDSPTKLTEDAQGVLLSLKERLAELPTDIQEKGTITFKLAVKTTYKNPGPS